MTELLMRKNRWLSVEEVTFMLEVHGKQPAVITENSYPVYQAHMAHFLIMNKHYEPIIPIS